MTELEKKQSGVTPTITRKKGSGDTSAPLAIEPRVSGLPPQALHTNWFNI